MMRIFKPTKNWQQRWATLVEKIERVQTSTEAKSLMGRLSKPAAPVVLAFANAHAMNSAASSPSFFNAIGSADIILRDGSGMATLFKMLKIPPGLNLNGTDLIPPLVKLFNGRQIAIFGTQNPYLQRGIAVVSQKLAPESSFVSAHGFLDVPFYTELAKSHRPELIILGMGMPRQEEVAAALRSALNFPCLIVCGGAIIDFLADKTPRAPAFMRKSGFEWLFRLAMEPRRLFVRYVVGNPLFLTRALRLASKSRG